MLHYQSVGFVIFSHIVNTILHLIQKPNNNFTFNLGNLLEDGAGVNSYSSSTWKAIILIVTYVSSVERWLCLG